MVPLLTLALAAQTPAHAQAQARPLALALRAPRLVVVLVEAVVVLVPMLAAARGGRARTAGSVVQRQTRPSRSRAARQGAGPGLSMTHAEHGDGARAHVCMHTR